LESAAYEERQRLARELHDAVSQTLFSATTIAGVLPQLWQRNPERAFEQLEQMVILNRAAMAEMRTLLLELRPEAIVRTTMQSLLHQLAEALQGRRRLSINVITEGDDLPLPQDVHVAVYRVAQESLNNAVKHSQATTIGVRLLRTASDVTLEVTDNGRGFDVSRTTPGFGLGTMQERADKINATIKIRSTPGNGTSVTLLWKEAAR
jgi:signal transduction histidine kinase